MKFITLTLGSHIISHGYNDNNEEITEEVFVNEFSKKLIAISRIQSVSEKYILTNYLDGRWIYWEYEESFNDVIALLNSKKD